MTLGASLDLAPVEGLQESHLFRRLRVAVVLRARPARMPHAAVGKTGPGATGLAREDGLPVPVGMELPVAAPGPGTPQKFRHGLQRPEQQQSVVLLEVCGRRLPLDVPVSQGGPALGRGDEGAPDVGDLALAAHLLVDVALHALVTDGPGMRASLRDLLPRWRPLLAAHGAFNGGLEGLGGGAGAFGAAGAWDEALGGSRGPGLKACAGECAPTL
eukprot:CAMPEP_0174349394 /NCGR_PEP_ID=MMETSP0811_2-20130205/6120_1 /TAXON_ID=73025 ORGANISM="Eutreptiella gymnastica-like, Strain CCMP1594" /NCGR_SAMPLE_ID=MMETSP0811_2 /ASSEMBLY_ACC=CAM_ASM_000667 /LENGTH=214 /DNA_ID=CAMNT_0015476743 /DNA_START=1409 /DNA_END=2054 /DNA_ORIENTATION=-